MNNTMFLSIHEKEADRIRNFLKHIKYANPSSWSSDGDNHMFSLINGELNDDIEFSIDITNNKAIITIIRSGEVERYFFDDYEIQNSWEAISFMVKKVAEGPINEEHGNAKNVKKTSTST